MSDDRIPGGAAGSNDQIAIVGIGCRFPGGGDGPERFWQLLRDGVDAITEMPADRFDLDRLYDPDQTKPGRIYVRWGGFITDIDKFDAQFFGVSPREATRIDVQHRMLLETTWAALEDAGLPPDRLAGTDVGVYVGISTHDYGDIEMHPENRHLIDAHSNTGTATSIAANRISYMYDFRGPSFTVDTACSSALTALHCAVTALRDGDCSVAVVAGVQALLAPELTIGFCKASMLSVDGRCKAFDASGNGYVRSEGVGVVVLKPLAQAIADGDPVYAVIRGTAINQDGRTNGMTVPRAESQAQMLRDALARAGVDARDVQYVEAHGPGTAVGDPQEAQALGAVFAEGREADEPLLIGSVKTNIGHLEAGSGVAGLIKAALALKHREIPASLHFNTPSPIIDFEKNRLRVVTKLEPWPETNGTPALAGVNSFGFGGANAHVVLQAAANGNGKHACHPERSEGSAVVLTLSARSEESLRAIARAYLDFIGGPDAPSLADICHTAALRRAHHDYRVGIVASTHAELLDGLDAYLAGEKRSNVVTGRAGANKGKLAFVFSGMGPQWWGMGRQLMASEPVFRRVIEECDRILAPYAGWSLLEELGRDENSSIVARADIAQVSNFAIQAGLAAVWGTWGVKPDAVIGHSAGEMAAAYVAGMLSLEDSLLLAYHRGRLQHRASGQGRMLAVGATPERVQPLLAGVEELVSLAAVNSPTGITLAGDERELQRIAQELERAGVFARMLPVLVPYHSPKMDAIREDLLSSLAPLAPHDGTIPMVSIVTGQRVNGAELTAEYWWRNVRQPVLFGPGIAELARDGHTTFMEVAPHPVLAASVNECITAAGTGGSVFASLRRLEDERAVMLRGLAGLYTTGRTPDWRTVIGGGHHVALPTYAFQRDRHWLETVPSDASEQTDGPRFTRPTDHPLLGRPLRAPRPTWESTLGGNTLEFLEDHLVQGTLVYPGAAYTETALSAAARRFPNRAPTIRDLEFHSALIIAARERTVLHFALDPVTSHFEIFSSADAKDETPWTLHTRGTLAERSPDEATTADLAAVRERCTNEISQEDYYRTLRKRGLELGPAFQGIEQLWQGDHEAIALVHATDRHIETERYQIHPALLDSIFQPLIGASLSDPEVARGQGVFLPIGVREITLFARPTGEYWSHARVVKIDPVAHSVEGDVTVMAEDGSVLVEIRGLTCRLLEQSADQVKDWLYSYGWEASGLGGDVAEPARIADGVGARVRDAQRVVTDLRNSTGWASYYDRVEPALNAIAVAFAKHALATLGWTAADNQVAEQSKRLFERVLAIASDSSTAADPEQLVTDTLREHPEFAVEVKLLAHAGRHLAGILRGTNDAREVLFAKDALALMEHMYRDATTARFHNALAAEAVAAAVRDGRADRPLRLLEIGAGTGGTTGYVLPRLSSERVSYTFTDVTPFFMERALAALPPYAGLVTRTLDIERDPATQGLADERFDVVLAANVLHSTAKLGESLAHVRSLLSPGGVLVLQEITRRPPWPDLIFGLTDGWWRFADNDVRPDHALLTPQAWEALLAAHGFEDVAVLAEAPAEGTPAQSIIVARAPSAPAEPAAAGEIAATGHLLVLADRGGVGDGLARRVRERGLTCTLVHERDGSDAATLVRLLDEAASTHADFRGIVHLWSLDAPSADADADTVLAAQRIVCGTVLDLFKSLGGRSLELWLVARGTQQIDADDRVPGVTQGALWGVGRTVMREAESLRCRLIELDDASPAAAELALDAFARELVTASVDEEVAFRGSRRYVRRMRRLGRDDGRRAIQAREPQAGEAFRIEVGTPGALETVGYRAFPTPVPGPDQVVVRVLASGLNFREVMLAMGMLPPKAADNTFGGLALGLDCAGIVEAVGENVDDIRVGDSVVASAPAAIASHVLTSRTLVLPCPSVLDAEQAAAVPVSWVTAHCALHRLAHVERGERVLIHAATGGVGLAAVQIAQAAGAEIFATAGSDEKRDYLRSLGVTHVLNSRSLQFAEDIRRITGGGGVDIIINSLAGDAIAEGLALLNPYGRFVEIGKRDIYQDTNIGMLALGRNISLHVLDIDRLTRDRPQLIRECMQTVFEQFETRTYTPLPQRVFPGSQVEGALRHMAQAKHIGKLVLRMDDPDIRVLPAASELSHFRADGTYLISGGLGGFGIALARHMVDRGARAIALVGRSAPNAETAAQLDALRASGARIEVLRGDVSRRDDVRRMLATVRSTMPPLRGVAHAAMVLDDVTIAETTYERFENVLSPKVAGGWNLHLETAGDPIEQFILFSSIAAMLGNPSQSSYCAANTFLDSLARHRRARGQPALTVYWGVLAETGYVSRTADVGDYLAAQGYLPFTPAQALAALDDLLDRDLPTAAAARFNWAIVPPAIARSSRFRDLVPAAGGGTGNARGSGASARAAIAAAAPDDRRGAAEQFLREKVGRVLGMAPARIDADRPLTEMGFDSLIAVELVTVLDMELGVEMQVLRLLQGITLSGLADAVLEQIAPATSRDVAPAVAPPTPAPVVSPVVATPAPISPAPVVSNGTHAENGARTNGHRAVEYASLDFSRWDLRQRVARGLVTAGFHTISRLSVEGVEHIPTSGGVLVAMNHLSMLDAPMMFTIFTRRATLFVNEKYQHAPVIGRLLDSIGQVIYVNPGSDNLSALDDGLAVLRGGGVLGIGPEGRRSRTGALEKAQMGAAYLAVRSGVPVLPIATWGQERIAGDWRRLKRAPVHVRIGEPMQFAQGDPDPRTLVDVTNRIMATLASMLPEQYRGVYA